MTRSRCKLVWEFKDRHSKRIGLDLAVAFQQTGTNTEELDLQPHLRIGWQSGRN